MKWFVARLMSALVLCCAPIVTKAADDTAALKGKYRLPQVIPFPKENPYTPDKAALGKMLFFDTRLSGAQNMNCAACHSPSFGWEAPVARAIGAMNKPLDRSAPTVLNHAWGELFFWDGRAKGLEEQAKGPIEAAVEMNMPMPKLVERLNGIPGYVSWFGKVFPGDGVTERSIVMALATYERTIMSSYAPFDAWIEGDERAISDSAKRGFALFNGKANCAVCHTGWNFTDQKFHDIGLPTDDIGRFKIDPSSEANRYAFRTPTLRDTMQRAPYMHNGSLATMDAVVAIYMTGGTARPSRSSHIKPFTLSTDERTDLVEFLKTLTGEKPVVPLPILPN